MAAFGRVARLMAAGCVAGGVAMAGVEASAYTLKAADGASPLGAAATEMGAAIGAALVRLSARRCATADAPVELFMDYRPLIAPSQGLSAKSRPQGGGLSLVKAPGVQVTARGAPCAGVIAHVAFDERARLQARAAADGGRAAGGGAVTERTFDDWARLYADTVVMTPPERRPQALEALRGKIPADLVWLFQRATQTTRGPFDLEARQAAQALAAEARRDFTASAVAAIDRAPGSEPRGNPP